MAFVMRKRLPHQVLGHIQTWALPSAFVVSLLAVLGPLFYSNIIGFEPCLLCWWQRIFMFPHVVILGVGLIRRDRMAAWHTLALSIIGGLISLYHYLLQFGHTGGLEAECSIVGQSTTCSDFWVNEFGYITIPLMALTSFVLVGVLSLFSIQVGKGNSS